MIAALACRSRGLKCQPEYQQRWAACQALLNDTHGAQNASQRITMCIGLAEANRDADIQQSFATNAPKWQLLSVWLVGFSFLGFLAQMSFITGVSDIPAAHFAPVTPQLGMNKGQFIISMMGYSQEVRWLSVLTCYRQLARFDCANVQLAARIKSDMCPFSLNHLRGSLFNNSIVSLTTVFIKCLHKKRVQFAPTHVLQGCYTLVWLTSACWIVVWAQRRAPGNIPVVSAKGMLSSSAGETVDERF